MMVFVFPPRNEDWLVPASRFPSVVHGCVLSVPAVGAAFSALFVYSCQRPAGHGTRTSHSRYYLAMPRPS